LKDGLELVIKLLVPYELVLLKQKRAASNLDIFALN
jgi:hypothetical protein